MDEKIDFSFFGLKKKKLKWRSRFLALLKPKYMGVLYGSAND